MKITVCELPDILDEQTWSALVAHVREHQSELVLLPEMPFHPWLMASDQVDEEQWERAVKAHGLERIDGLFPAIVIGTRPIRFDGHKYNEAFVIKPDQPYQALHRKVYLPDEEGFWEATWYDAAPPEFVIDGNIGSLICTEMWFGQHVQDYTRQGMQILAVPRATPLATTQKWVGSSTQMVRFSVRPLHSSLS